MFSVRNSENLLFNDGIGMACTFFFFYRFLKANADAQRNPLVREGGRDSYRVNIWSPNQTLIVNSSQIESFQKHQYPTPNLIAFGEPRMFDIISTPKSAMSGTA